MLGGERDIGQVKPGMVLRCPDGLYTWALSLLEAEELRGQVDNITHQFFLVKPIMTEILFLRGALSLQSVRVHGRAVLGEGSSLLH